MVALAQDVWLGARIEDHDGVLALVSARGHALGSIIYNPTSASSRRQSYLRLVEEARWLGYQLVTDEMAG